MKSIFKAIPGLGLGLFLAALLLPVPASAQADRPEAPTAPAVEPPLPTEAGREAEVERIIFDLVNGERESRGLPLLARDEDLARLAFGHSQDMLERNFMDHINPDGLSPSDRIGRGHRKLIGATGENVWEGTGYGDLSVGELARLIHKSWMGSPGHRKNILKPKYTHLGIGVIRRGEKVKATQKFSETWGYLAEGLPRKIKSGSMVNLNLATPKKPAMIDLWVEKKGVGLGKLEIPENGMVLITAPPGEYQMRFYFLKSSVGNRRSYIIVDGPMIIVE